LFRRFAARSAFLFRGIADSALPPVTALGTALQIPTQSLQTFTSAGDIVPTE
jgi:hypothetical protein